MVNLADAQNALKNFGRNVAYPQCTRASVAFWVVILVVLVLVFRAVLLRGLSSIGLGRVFMDGFSQAGNLLGRSDLPSLQGILPQNARLTDNRSRGIATTDTFGGKDDQDHKRAEYLTVGEARLNEVFGIHKKNVGSERMDNRQRNRANSMYQNLYGPVEGMAAMSYSQGPSMPTRIFPHNGREGAEGSDAKDAGKSAPAPNRLAPLRRFRLRGKKISSYPVPTVPAPTPGA